MYHRILEWVAISFSRGSSRPKDQTRVSWIAGSFPNVWATREDLNIPYDPAISLLGIYLGEMKIICPHKDVDMNVHRGFILKSKLEMTQMFKSWGMSSRTWYVSILREEPSVIHRMKHWHTGMTWMDLENMVSGNSQTQKTTGNMSSTDIKFPEKTIWEWASRWVVAWGWAWKRRLTVNGHKGALEDDESVLETELWWWLHNSINLLKSLNCILSGGKFQGLRPLLCLNKVVLKTKQPRCQTII